MNGVVARGRSPRICLPCKEAGRGEFRLSYYVYDVSGLTVTVYAVCEGCQRVQLSTPARKNWKAFQVLAFVVIGEIIAVGAIAVAHAALASVR